MLLVFVPVLAFGDDEVFIGAPTVRVDSDANETKRVELSDAAAQKYECRIVRKGRKYLWASRGNRELTRTDAGDYVYFVSEAGSGYVKIFTGEGGESSQYLEHLGSELKTITYWGKRISFRR
jgi:hypothetical protein